LPHVMKLVKANGSTIYEGKCSALLFSEGSDFPACFSTRFESSYSWHRDDRGICGSCRYHWGMASRKWRMGLYIRIMGCLEQGMLQARFVKNTLVSSRMEEMFTRKPKMIWRVSWKLQMFLCELISFSAVKLHGTLML
jgi:hypothetical protein